MRINRINNQTTDRTFKNNRPAFGMYFNMKPQVYDEFYGKMQKIDSGILMGPMGKGTHIKNFRVLMDKSPIFMQKLLRDMIEHNKTIKNHFIYNDKINITKADISSFLIENKKATIPSLLDSQPDIQRKLLNSEPLFFDLYSDEGNKFSFPVKTFNSVNLASKMQDDLISGKSYTGLHIRADIAELFKKLNS